MSESLTVLCSAAATIGVMHTLLGPDHYLPFVAMSRAGGWSLGRTLWVTLLCGVGHLVGSIVLGLVGIAAGVAVFRLEGVESARGALAGWLLLGFGLVYFVYGVRRAVRRRPHSHWHAHADGTVHVHAHVHVNEHAHVHTASAATDAQGRGAHAGTQGRVLTPWVLFTIFVFGPCEPLIPLLMYPAAKGSWADVAIVTVVFSAATLLTMTGAVLAAQLTLSAILWRGVERFSHAVAGFVVLLCGAAMKLGL